MAASPQAESKRDDRGQKKSLPAVLFDLDGTLVDSNYEHVIAYREAFGKPGTWIPNARIHRGIGMSGKLVVRALFREIGRRLSDKQIDELDKLHKRNFARRLGEIRLLPGARDLLKYLTLVGVRWVIATSGDRKTVETIVKPLRIPAATPIITGDDVDGAKPDPDVFLAAASRLRVSLADCIVVGDSVWDLLAARRAKAIGVGLLCGGSGKSELEEAGAYRVYQDPADLFAHITEIGMPPA